MEDLLKLGGGLFDVLIVLLAALFVVAAPGRGLRLNAQVGLAASRLLPTALRQSHPGTMSWG